MNTPRSRLIVALDLPDRATALAAVNRLAGHTGHFKIGLELFVREGPRLVEEIRGRGESVFLDLKMHDIPNTVAAAVRSASKLGVQMLTVHAAGGRSMLEAAQQAALSSTDPPLLLAVTALTSLSPSDIHSIGIGTTTQEWVNQLASLAIESGIRGIVTSALEAANLRSMFGSAPQLVIPGIRPAGEATQDQSRIARPAEAMRAGADYLVVGRPILKAADPARAADDIVDEIEAAMRELARH